MLSVYTAFDEHPSLDGSPNAAVVDLSLRIGRDLHHTADTRQYNNDAYSLTFHYHIENYAGQSADRFP
jgi:hypothetical protein